MADLLASLSVLITAAPSPTIIAETFQNEQIQLATCGYINGNNASAVICPGGCQSASNLGVNYCCGSPGGCPITTTCLDSRSSNNGLAGCNGGECSSALQCTNSAMPFCFTMYWNTSLSGFGCASTSSPSAVTVDPTTTDSVNLPPPTDFPSSGLSLISSAHSVRAPISFSPRLSTSSNTISNTMPGTASDAASSTMSSTASNTMSNSATSLSTPSSSVGSPTTKISTGVDVSRTGSSSQNPTNTVGGGTIVLQPIDFVSSSPNSSLGPIREAAVAGAVLGALNLLALGIAIAMFLLRRCRRKRNQTVSQETQTEIEAISQDPPPYGTQTVRFPFPTSRDRTRSPSPQIPVAGPPENPHLNNNGLQLDQNVDHSGSGPRSSHPTDSNLFSDEPVQVATPLDDRAMIPPFQSSDGSSDLPPIIPSITSHSQSHSASPPGARTMIPPIQSSEGSSADPRPPLIPSITSHSPTPMAFRPGAGTLLQPIQSSGESSHDSTPEQAPSIRYVRPM